MRAIHLTIEIDSEETCRNCSAFRKRHPETLKPDKGFEALFPGQYPQKHHVRNIRQPRLIRLDDKQKASIHIEEQKEPADGEKILWHNLDQILADFQKHFRIEI